MIRWVPLQWSRFICSTGRLLRFLLAGYGLFLLLLFYSPATDYLVRPLWVPADVRSAPAIVVLTSYAFADIGLLDEPAMRRIHGAAQLYRKGYAPLVIISGGDPSVQHARQPADLMAQFAEELGVPPSAILLEKQSEDTHASAVHVAALCRQRGIERVLLVSDAMHMRRAVSVFHAQRLPVSPVPVDPWALIWETPQMRLGKFWGAMHEYGGLLYYWWKGWI